MVEEWAGEVAEVDGEEVVVDGEDHRVEDTAAAGMEGVMVADGLGMGVEVGVMAVAMVGGEVEWEVEDDDRKGLIFLVDQRTRYGHLGRCEGMLIVC